MKKIEDTISKEKLEHYLGLTKKQETRLHLFIQDGSKESEMLAILLRMADDYTSDANYFMENGDYVRAFGAINYAHAWIDAGIKLRLLDGHGDDELFTLP